MKALSDCSLYTFVDTAFLAGRSAGLVAQQLCDGGSDIIQLRAKNESPDAICRLAESLIPITRAAGIPLVINDYFEIAQNIGAEYCHLGQADFFDAGYTHVKQLARPERPLPIGLSTHGPDQAKRALAAEPAYIAIGPVYATGTKPTAKPVTLEYVRWAAAEVKIPWFAIGGINLQTLPAVLDAGARRICVISAILTAENLVKTCQQFKQRLTG